MPLSNALTYDQTPWHRPGIDELGGGSFLNATTPRDPNTVPAAETFNQLTRQVVAQAALAASVRFQVQFSGGVPAVTAIVALNSSLVTSDLTLTDNGNGDTTITIPSHIGEQLRPCELTIAEDVEVDRWRIFAVAGGWRVKTKLGSTGTDAAFVVALHAPAFSVVAVPSGSHLLAESGSLITDTLGERLTS